MTSYYNEVDKHAAAWLRELVKAGHIADGIVDERDIQDVLPSDLAGFTQCHFFAGIGVWSYALGLAGWPDDQPVWTGSCPCQPFSAAGKGDGFADERHLWPYWFHLIEQRRPPVLFGEQVASKNADPWIDLVQDDLEALGYAFGAVPFPAAGIGAPHIRDRTYWVADSYHAERRSVCTGGNDSGRQDAGRPQGSGDFEGRSSVRGMADNAGSGRREERADAGRDNAGDGAQGITAGLVSGGADCRVAHPNGAVSEQFAGARARSGEAPGAGPYSESHGRGALGGSSATDGPTNGFWRSADWLHCRDHKWRPVEPGSFPLVDGAAARVVRGGSDGLPIDSDKTGEARVMRLRGYGNSINAVAAKAFIESFMDRVV